jgi:hypothetical protein
MVARAVLLVVFGGCISEEPRASDATVDAEAEVAGEPCESPGAHECVSTAEARVCEGGVWRRAPCPDKHSCSRSTGTCSKGTSSCLGVLLCSIDCQQGDQGCGKECGEAATVPAVDALGDLNDCQCQQDCWPILCGRLLPWPTYDEISACVTLSCAGEAATCAGGGATGTSDCGAVRSCLLECDGDVFCEEGCFAQGTKEAQTMALFYYACVRRECGPGPSQTCLFQAQAGTCSGLFDACRGISTESGDGR